MVLHRPVELAGLIGMWEIPPKGVEQAKIQVQPKVPVYQYVGRSNLGLANH